MYFVVYNFEKLYELNQHNSIDENFIEQFIGHNHEDKSIVGNIKNSQLSNAFNYFNTAGIILKENDKFKGIKEYY